MVALYLPMLIKMGVTNAGLMALAAAALCRQSFHSGRASNVIIIQNAERKSGETLTFWNLSVSACLDCN